jgi:hypothetical protein
MVASFRPYGTSYRSLGDSGRSSGLVVDVDRQPPPGGFAAAVVDGLADPVGDVDAREVLTAVRSAVDVEVRVGEVIARSTVRVWS